MEISLDNSYVDIGAGLNHCRNLRYTVTRCHYRCVRNNEKRSPFIVHSALLL